MDLAFAVSGLPASHGLRTHSPTNASGRPPSPNQRSDARVVFGSVAALGAGLEVAVDAAAHHEVSPGAAAWSVAVPVAVCPVVLMRLDRRAEDADPSRPLVLGGALLVLVAAALVDVLGIGVAVLIMGVIVAALVTTTVALADRRDVAPAVVGDAPVDPS